MYSITLLRHGRSQADDEDRFEARYDSPLTEVGRQQVRSRGEELKTRRLAFDTIIASPLLRASETAEIVGRILGLQVESDADWMERDNGPLAGLSHQEAEEKYPAPYSPLRWS